MEIGQKVRITASKVEGEVKAVREDGSVDVVGQLEDGTPFEIPMVPLSALDGALA